MYDLTSSRLHPGPGCGCVRVSPARVPWASSAQPPSWCLSWADWCQAPGGHLVETQPLYTAGGHFLHLTVTQTAEIYKDSGDTAIARRLHPASADNKQIIIVTTNSRSSRPTINWAGLCNVQSQGTLQLRKCLVKQIEI